MTPRFGAALGIAVLAALAGAAPGAFAQFGPSPDQPNRRVTAATRKATVDTLAARLEALYVFPDVAAATAKELLSRLEDGAYDDLDSAKAFADTLTAHLRAVGRDRHFRVLYYDRTLAPDAFQPREPSAEERQRAAEQSRRLNYGFERIQRLSGNVGYLDLRGFDGSPEAGARAMAAMSLLGDTDALIVDLRRNGGGDPNMIILLLSWLFPANERVHVNDFAFRDSTKTEQYWTLTSLPGPRYTGKELYVLTSSRTGSAAEEFSYDVKQLKRGTLVGETTAGAANPGGLVRLGEHFAAFISNGRAVNPITNTNWEGVGVEPDVKVAAEQALKTAHVAALEKLIAQATDPERKAALERARDQAKDAPVEPLDLGPQRRPAAPPPAPPATPPVGKSSKTRSSSS
jgi:hypothetical protein